MLDEREADVDPAEVDQAFNRKSVWRRIAIVAAGPAANLLLCVLLLWAMFVVGRPGYAPVVGHVDGIAAESGLRRGDPVLAVGERVFQTWDGMQMALLPPALDRQDVDRRAPHAGGQDRWSELAIPALPAGPDAPRGTSCLSPTRCRAAVREGAGQSGL